MTAPPGEGWIERGRAALRQGDWETARTAYQAALDTAALDPEQSPEAWYGLGQAAYWLCDYPAALEGFERAYTGLRARGETQLPAYLAALLAYEHLAVFGNAAVSSGWRERALRLAEQGGEFLRRGWVEIWTGLLAGDPVEKEHRVRTALRIAERFGSADLQFHALAYLGECQVERGEVTEGLRRVDEAAAAATSGEITDLFSIGEIYCKMLVCCEITLDVRRAEQWMVAAESFVRRTNFLPISAICRTHYGGILTAAGRWAEAETELTTAARIYSGGYRTLRPAALVRLADLRIRQGRYDEAAHLLTGHEHDSYAVRPLARLHLARDESELAATVLRRHTDRTGGRRDPQQAPVLALLAEAEAATGDLTAARGTCRRLAELAHTVPVPYVRALASYAAGLTCLAADDRDPAGTPVAVGPLEAALADFAAAGLPLEEARSRFALARALAGHQPAVAVAEARTALGVFQRLDAVPDADAAGTLLRRLGAPGRSWPRQGGPGNSGALTRREAEVLRMVAEGASNAEIAARLYLSKRTVEHHVGNIFAKLGVTSRGQAIAAALRRDVAGADQPVSGRVE